MSGASSSVIFTLSTDLNKKVLQQHDKLPAKAKSADTIEHFIIRQCREKLFSSLVFGMCIILTARICDIH